MSETFTLHSNLTKEDWDLISDAEMKYTNQVTFSTPSGREVVFMNLSLWLSSFNTDSATECFTAVQQLKNKLNGEEQ